MLLPVAPSGNGGWVVIIAHNRTPHSHCGWLGAIYNTTHYHASPNWVGPRFTQAEGSGPRQTVPFLGLCSLAVCCLHRRLWLGPGQYLGTQQQALRRPLLQRDDVFDHGLSQPGASHYFVSQLVSFHSPADRSRYDVMTPRHCAASHGRHLCHECGGGSST